MKRLICGFGIASLLAGLAACGERIQTATPRKADEKAWAGANEPFVAAGWKAGDKDGWEGQLRTRAQAQNEYNRVR
ncbi:MAG TPA: hypothetical protein VJ598_06060 [Albitalea sp.]|nr:hypothetical protein [Albitalea sp.]